MTLDVLKDSYLLEFATYEDYLDSYLSKEDMLYIRNIPFARTLVELGYRTASAVLTKDEFESRKEIATRYLLQTTAVILFSENIHITCPFLKELALREQPNYQKIISTIIYVQVVTKSGLEISGYIDFQQTLEQAHKKVEGAIDWNAVFNSRKILKPRPSDLSYHNWQTGVTKYNNSLNYEVYTDSVHGILFGHKGDRRMISPNPHQEGYGVNVSRTPVLSPKYKYTVFYDHVIRRKV